MKKFWIIALIAVIVLDGAFGIYKYFFEELVDYYTIIYIPPYEKEEESNAAEDEAWLAKVDITPYHDEKSEKYAKMVEAMREELALTSLHFQSLDDLIEAIGLPKEKVCTYCWDGKDECACEHCSGCRHDS